MTENQQKKPKKQKQPNKWVSLTGAGIQMGVIIFATAYLGKKLDVYYETQTAWFTLGFVLFGIFISLYLLIKQINNLNA